tara:strand:+ start:74 stop:541 length:468 start_codon:yes stop_codon:yes gene_type:complete
MIYYSIKCKNNHWPRRIKKIDRIIKKILLYKDDLSFTNDINYYCNFILANDTFIKNLNRKFRKKNTPTDILTFVYKNNINNKTKEKHCDIILSFETITKDAKKNKIEFYNHLTHLLIHGMLHVNEYMHKKIKDFMIMKNKEINILNQLGINSPYN